MHWLNQVIIKLGTVMLLLHATVASAASVPTELKVDYTVYNPLSLVIRKFQWLEKEFAHDRVAVKWTYIPSSNIALDYLQDDRIDVASSAIASAVWREANGARLKAVYVCARSEISCLLVQRDSPITSLQELRGKTVAAPPGSAPLFFLLRALRQIGMHKEDVNIVPMSHEAARAALECHEIDAWAGILPYTSSSQLECGSRELWRNRNIAFTSLIITEKFAQEYPAAASRIIRVYEKARKWALQYPDDLEEIYAEQTHLPLPIAQYVLNKHDFFNPFIDRNDIETAKDASEIFKEEHLISPETDLQKVVDELVDRRFFLMKVFHQDDNASAPD